MPQVVEQVTWSEIEATLDLPKAEPPRPRWPGPRTAVAVASPAARVGDQRAPSKLAVPQVRTRAERLGMFALGTLGVGTWFLIGLLEMVCNGSFLGPLRWGFLAMTPIGLTAGIVAGSWAGGAVTALRMGIRYVAATLFLLAAPVVSLVSLFVGAFFGVFYVMLRLSFFY